MASISCVFCTNAWISNVIYEDLTRTLTLRRIDHIRNMARFYRLDVQPNLFGGVSLMKEWGRIGSRGRITAEHSDSEPNAADALRRQADRKRRRGYIAGTP
jgi:predicted DNA-binding WGR domain protein